MKIITMSVAKTHLQYFDSLEKNQDWANVNPEKNCNSLNAVLGSFST